MSKAGRKRKGGVPRTPSGQRSRAASSYQENVEPILTRMRMYGLSEFNARDQKASTFIGRLMLGNLVSSPQYDAAIEFLQVYERYQRALKSPDALRTSSEGGAGGVGESDSYEDWCHSSIDLFEQAMKAVRAEQNILDNRGRNLYAALDYVVRRDEQMWHLVEDARLALNALARHFGILGKGRHTERVDKTEKPVA